MEMLITLRLSYKPANCWYTPQHWLPLVLIVLYSWYVLAASRGSVTINEQIALLSTRRAPTTPPHPTLTPSCYLPLPSSNVALFSIDEIDLEEILHSSKVETVSLTSVARVNMINQPISRPPSYSDTCLKRQAWLFSCNNTEEHKTDWE